MTRFAIANPRTFLLLILAPSSLLTAACFEGKTVVTRVRPHAPGAAQPRMNGVLFALPRTVVKVDLPVIQEIKKAGQFAKLSPFFFPGESFVAGKQDTILPTTLEPKLGKTKKEGAYYGLDDPKFSTRGEPDPEQTFMVNIRGGKFETKTLMLELTEDGIIAKAEAESKNEAIDIFTEGLKSVVEIAAPLFPFADLPVPLTADVNPEERCKQLFQASLTPTEKMLYTSVGHQDFLEKQIGLCYLAQLGTGVRGEKARLFFWNLSNKQILYYQTNFGLAQNGYPDRQSDLPRAKVAYDRVQKLISQRAALVSNQLQQELPADTLAQKLKEFDSYINSYKQNYFVGSSNKNTWIGNFELTPPRTSPYVLGLLTYSETHGICGITGGKGVKGIFPPGSFMTDNCEDGKSVLVQLDVSAGQLSQNLREANFNENGERGFYYRVPAKTSIVLCERELKAGASHCEPQDELARDEIAVAQLGEIASLPASTGGRRSSYKIAYYSSTGAIQTFNLASDALIQKSNVSDIESAAKELRDAKTEQIKRDTERLKAEKELIEAKEALKKAKEGSSNSNSNTP